MGIRAWLAAGSVLLAFPAAAPAATRAGLDLTDGSPVTARGHGFRPAEPIRVTLVMGDRTWVRLVRASSAGSFRVVFAGVRLRVCAQPLILSARGPRTGRVEANLPKGVCAPP